MHLWRQTLQTAIQIGTEWIKQEESNVGQGPLYLQVLAWLEAYADKLLSADGVQPQQRQAQLAIVKQLRTELETALADLPPVQAMALLCRLPSARELGYASERLAAALAVTEAELQLWERQAYKAIWQRVKQGEEPQTETLPLLLFLAQQTAGLGEEKADQSQASLLQQAGQEAAFDLRAHVTAAKELAIRQLLHRFGLTERARVKENFPKEEQFVVDLVAERMAFEMEMQGKEEAADADA